MTRALLWTLVLLMAVVPAANGVCGLGCDLEGRSAAAPVAPAAGSQECPLHQQGGPLRPDAHHAPASDRCGHDHTIGRTGLLRANGDAPRPVDSVMALAPPSYSSPLPVDEGLARIALHVTPPDRPSRPRVLRI